MTTSVCPAVTCCSFWTIPDGQRTSTSTSVTPSPRPKCSGPALDEGLDALARIRAVQHALANRRNAGDRRGLALLGIFRGGLLGHLDAERRVARDDRGERHGAIDLLAGRHDLLDEADLTGALRVEFIAQEQVIHRITPAGAPQEAEMRAAQRRNAALGFHLAGVAVGDTLSPDGERLPKADLILTNPPFGTKKGGGRPTRSDFSITADTSNKQLAFVEHVVRSLKPGGRAAVVVPDNVLFEDNTGQRLRSWLMELCNLRTILRLPTGIFYAQGVKTNVLFFQRGKADKANTKAVWVYDMRADAPAFGKTRPLTVQDFVDFENVYGGDPNGGAKRKDQGEEGRWRCFTREAVKARNDNLDISWLRDTELDTEEHLTEPDDIAAAIIGHLKAALEDIEGLSDELEPDTVEKAAAAVAEAAE